MNDYSTAAPLDDRLFDLVCDVVEDGLKFISFLEGEKKYISKHLNFPEVSSFKSGFPHLTHDVFSDIKDYSSAFSLHKTDDSHKKVDELASFHQLMEHVRTEEHLLICLSPDRELSDVEDGKKASYARWGMFFLIICLIERYKHVYDDRDFERRNLLPLFIELERGVFGENLPVDIVIPISLTKFETEHYELNESTSIERIDSKLHMARSLERHESIGIHEDVLGAATHALRLEGWVLTKNEGFLSNFGNGKISTYPVQHVDNFFTALRLSAHIHTGYVQIIYVPIEWAKTYKADLPFIYRGPYVRKYPSVFEQNYWHVEDLPVVSEENLQEVKYLYQALMDTDRNQLQIASRRLNLCYLRDEEEDTILDATIALEALLAGNARTEITYRLALRLAALSTLVEGYIYSPSEIFDSVKKIYDFRSAVVHGSSTVDKKREVTLSDARSVPSVSLAIEFLRMALKTLIEHPKYLDGKLIDKELLLNTQQ